MTTETLMNGAQATDAAASDAAATTGDTPAAQTSATPAATEPSSQNQQPNDTTAEGNKPAAEAKPDDQTKPAGAPEKYEAFKLDEGALSADEVSAVEKLARDLNLPQDAAQKLAEARAADKAAAQASNAQALQDARAQWVSDVKNDKEIGGDKLAENLSVAKKGLQIADPKGELAKLLESTGFGDHPEVIRAFHRIGTAISEDRFVPAKGTPSAPKDAASRLYPNQQ
jgi:hypothetical protein